MSGNVLMFSIALNGYQWLYKHCIETHRQYATINGYKYEVVTHPFVTKIGVECCWLKLTLLKAALKAGYDTVCFLDADTMVKPCTPPLNNAFKSRKLLYLARSYSKRFNSGVIIVRNHQKLREWVDQVLSRRHLKVEHHNDVCWGENGHIIQQTKDCDFVCTLDRRWNNTYDKSLDDYIRHFNHGPLRQSHWLKTTHFALSRLTRMLAKVSRMVESNQNQANRQDPLDHLTDSVLTHYHSFLRI